MTPARLFRRSTGSWATANYALLTFLIVVLVGHQLLLVAINYQLGGAAWSNPLAGLVRGESELDLSGDLLADAIKLVVPTGIPAVYGQELGVDYGQVQQSMNALSQFDPTYGRQKIALTGEELRRYTAVGLRISCEYCCSAKSIIQPNGQAACGCAHSQAMRGLLAYLIRNHSNQYSDDELLRELARWKGTYFPKQMIQKISAQLQGQAAFTPDTAALVLGLKLPDYGAGQPAPLPSEIKNLPSMVGGC